MTVLQQTFVGPSAGELLLQYAAVVAKIRTSAAGAAANPDAAADAESTIAQAQSAVESNNLLPVVTQYATDAASLIALVQAIIRSFEESTSEKGVLKIKLVTQLFNSLSTTSILRFTTYTALAKLAAKHGELAALAPSIQHVAAWANDWQVSTDQLASLYTLLAEKLIAAGQWAAAVTALTAHIAYASESASKAELETLYTKAVVAALAPAREVVDLTDLYLSPVTKAELSGTLAASLVDAYVHGDYATYASSIHKQMPALIAKAGIKAKSLPAAPAMVASTQDKLRMLYLTTLPVGKTHLLADIAAALELPAPRNVEIVFISAVSRGLVQGKINGLEGTVVLTSAVKPHLEEGDWEALLADLQAWKAGLAKVAESIHQLRDDDEDDDDVDESDLDESEVETDYESDLDGEHENDVEGAREGERSAEVATDGEDDGGASTDVDADYVKVAPSDAE
ncbi:hypothetical protein BCR44DRAFT_1495036 [Catenaria anguillulae PL171]|uniref:PCI domain-containing protein n=1 Tax=Catenaria anguillulae PL171 TaxID=765915 RepID=A0A1Y2I3W5_9FUNG|nr:hypothetical protein BCR44DRAFT_1495036 [Catenaria anguillulae PL171]